MTGVDTSAEECSPVKEQEPEQEWQLLKNSYGVAYAGAASLKRTIETDAATGGRMAWAGGAAARR